MARDIKALPAEVIEKFLSFLQGEDLIKASKVCWQWTCIAHRMIEKLNSCTFSSELLEDIKIDVEEKQGDPVLDIYRESIENLSEDCEIEGFELEHSISAMEADGTRIYIGDGSGNLLVYEMFDIYGESTPFLSPEPTASAILPDDGPVMHLGLMKRYCLLIAASPSGLHLYSTQLNQELIRNNEPATLDLCSSSLPELNNGLSVRVYKNLIGITEGNSKIKVFRVLGVKAGVVNVEVITEFETPCGIYRWKIWNNQVLCVLKTGGLLVWDLSVNNCCHISEPYHELRYQNPCWMFQRYVLCSSELSRNLLSYWHISCGPSYWLFGRLDGKQVAEPEKYRGILSPDVTAMCLRRRVFVCARKSPNQLQVYLMPKNLPHDKQVVTEALQNPVVTVPAPGHVVMLELAFLGPRVLVFSVSQPSLLHCYVFTREGHGTTASPRLSLTDSINSSELDLSNVPNINQNLAYPVFEN